MALKLIIGPPNSGRVGLVLDRFKAALEDAPVLVVPNLDDAFRTESELCATGCALGGVVTTFNGLFALVAAASGEPSPPQLTAAQRLRAVAAASGRARASLGPLRRSATRSGFAASLERLLADLQAAGLHPAEVEAGAATLEGSAYLTDLATLFAEYERAREQSGRVDAQGVADRALALLRDRGAQAWGPRPVLAYGLDDLTASQFELLRLLSAVTEVTLALPHEDGREVLAERGRLVERLRDEIGVAEEIRTEPDFANTDSRLLFELERRFGVDGADPVEPDGDLVLLRSAGERGEAEAIAAHVSRLLGDGADPETVAIVLRDPARRGPLIARVLESYGVGVALEAELAVAATGVGGALLALLESEYGTARAADVLRWLRGPSGVSASRVDWFERQVRQGRIQTAPEALQAWLEGSDELPYDLRALRGVETGGLAAAIGETASRMALRFLGGDEDGPRPGPGDGTELQAAAAISTALSQVAELGSLSPGPTELIELLRDLRFRAWIGPIENRVRIADPHRLRAGRFQHVVIGSLQDGEFPRRGGGDPFLSDAQRDSLGLEARRDDDAEERYLFYTSLGLAQRSLCLSYRDSDEAGAAQARSPLLDDVRALLAPAPEAEGPDPVEARLTRDRGLTDVVHAVSAAPSEDELARAVAALRDRDGAERAIATAAPDQDSGERLARRLAIGAVAEAATRAPGPIVNPAVLASLRAVPAYGGTTLEGFDKCSYRWFTDHELRPKPLDPLPDAIVQGGLMHDVLERLYEEKPGGAPLSGEASLELWRQRGLELIDELADERGLGTTPTERAMRRTVERLLVRFLGEEAGRESGDFAPALLEAGFGDDEQSAKPALELDGWRLHGAIDRIDLDPEGRALVHDYKVASRAAPAAKLEEEAKLQLQLYLIAAAELWGTTPIGALYHPLRATTSRQPRGMVRKDAEDLPDFGLVGTDLLEPDRFEALLDEARERSGTIVARMRDGDIRRDPGPRPGFKEHDVCPAYCDFAPICRRDRAPVADEDRDLEER